MAVTGQMQVDGEACLIAAEQMQRKLMAVARKVEQCQDPTVSPNNPLPVDCFFKGMINRVNASRIVLKPRRLKDLLWTESVTAYVYAGIERAFVKAGRLPGSKRAGYRAELKKLKTWIERQEKSPDRQVPEHFVQKQPFCLLMEYWEKDASIASKLSCASGIAHQRTCRIWPS